MRLAVELSRICLIAASAALCPPLLSAQAPSPPRFTVTRDLALDGRPVAFRPDARLAIREDGMVAIANPDEADIRLFDRTGALVRTIIQPTPSGGGRRAGVGRLGWTGDSIWARLGAEVVVFPVSAGGTPSRRISLAMRVTGPPGSTPVTHEAGLLQQADIRALLPDGEMILGEGQVFATIGPNGSFPQGAIVYFLRVAADGSYRSGLGFSWYQTPGCTITYTNSYRQVQEVSRPLCRTPDSFLAPGGRSLASIFPVGAPGDSSQFLLLVTGMKGDTLLKREYDYPAIRATSADLDSALARISGPSRNNREFMDQEWPLLERAFRASRVATFLPLRALLLGSDGSVWIEVPSREPGHHWQVLDRNGTITGTALIPESVTLKHVSATAAWGFERGDLTAPVVTLVRYQVRLP